MKSVTTPILGMIVLLQLFMLGCESTGPVMSGLRDLNPFAKTASPISELNDQELKATGQIMTVASVYAMPLLMNSIGGNDEAKVIGSLAVPLGVMGASYVASEVVKERQERYESEIALLDEEIALAEKTLEAKEKELASLRESIDRLQREIDQFIASAGRDQDAQKKAEATRVTLKNQIEQNNAAIVGYNQTIAYIDALLEERATVEGDQAALEERQTTLREQRAEFVGQRDQLYAMITEQDRQYNQLESIAMGRN